MKFQDLELYHVGRHNGPVFTGLEDGFNVVYGPNEAGKSTLMAGLRAMLFGRLSGSEPHLGAVRGAAGLLRARSESGNLYTLERALGRKSPVKVYGTDFEPKAGDEGLFAAFPELEQLESSIYQSVFTFQLQELSDLSEHRSQLAHKLYTVGMIGDTSPLQMEENFEKSAKAIYNPDKRSKNPLLTQCLSSLQELKEEQSKQHDEIAAFLAVEQQIRQVEERLHEQEKEVERISERRGHLLRVKQVLPLYQSAQVSLAEQDLYGERYEIPEAMTAKAQRLEADMNRLHSENSRNQESIRRQSSELQHIEVNTKLLSRLSQIQKQASRREKMLTLADLLEESRQSVTELQVKNEELTSRLSGDWSLQELSQLRIDAQTLARATEHLEMAKQLVTQRQQLEQQVHTWKEQVVQRSERLQSLGVSTESVEREIEWKQQELKRRRSQLYTDEEQVETYAELSEQKANLEQDIHGIQNETKSILVTSNNKDGTLGLVLGLGVVLGVLGLWQFVGGQTATGVVTLLTAVAAVAVSLWMGKHRRVQDSNRASQVLDNYLKELQAKMQRVITDMSGALKKIQSFSPEEDVSPGSLRRCVKQRQLDLKEEAESLRQLEITAASFLEADKALESLHEQIQYVLRQEERLQQDSHELQQQTGWGRQVSISTWVEELHIVQEMMENQWEIRRQLKKVTEYEAEVRSFVAQVNHLMSPDSPPASSRESELAAATLLDESAALWNADALAGFQQEIRLLLAQIREASDELPHILREAEAAQEAQRQLQSLERRIGETRTELAARQQKLEETEREVEEIYHVCGVTSQEEFHQFLGEVKEYQELKSTYRDATLQLYGYCGGEEQYRALEKTLQYTSIEQIEEDLNHNQEQLQAARSTHDHLNTQLAEQKAKLRHWDSQERVKLEWKLAQVQAERDKLAYEWAGYKMAEALVKTARERYEEQRQPEVLKAAGELFRQVTNGRYKGLKSRFDEQGAAHFVAVDARSREWSFASLSRGTREQIYLCLRIGLIRDYLTRGVKMPLVLDDPLVNFDADRLDASLRLLAETARECQILYLTCHRSTFERISRVLPAYSIELSLAEGER